MVNFVNPTSLSASPTLNVTTLLATPSSSLKVEGKKTGVVAKVPAVVGKTVVQVYIEALADLDEPALEITNIKHDVNMTNCEFMKIESAKNGKLIMSGYIRENIEYISAKVAEDGTANIGNKRTGMNIPFKCFTKIQLDSEPEISSNSLADTEENGIQGAVIDNSLYYSTTNEDLKFEVAETKIRQVNVKRNTTNLSINDYDEEAFSGLSINMAVDIAVLIMQDQYVAIPSSGGNSGSSSNGSGGNNGKSKSNGNSNGNGNNKKNSGNNNKGKQKNSSKSSKYAWVNNFNPYTKMFGK